MGTLAYPIAIAPALGGDFQELEALVDTGASYTWAPRSILERLGIVPEEETTFILADGRRANYSIAQVRVRLDGRIRFSICVFGEEGTQPLLGAVTLEEFGLAVDLLNQRLIPVPRYLLKAG